MRYVLYILMMAYAYVMCRICIIKKCHKHRVNSMLIFFTITEFFYHQYNNGFSYAPIGLSLSS